MPIAAAARDRGRSHAPSGVPGPRPVNVPHSAGAVSGVGAGGAGEVLSLGETIEELAQHALAALLPFIARAVDAAECSVTAATAVFGEVGMKALDIYGGGGSGGGGRSATGGAP